MPPPLAGRPFPWKTFTVVWLALLVAAGWSVAARYHSFREKRIHQAQTILRGLSDLTTASKLKPPAQTPAEGSAVTGTPSEHQPAGPPILIFAPKENARLFVGVVFTEHGETKDLSGMVVSVYPEDDLRAYLETRKASGKREQEQLAPAVQEAKRVQEQAEAKTRAAYELMVSAIDDKPKREEYQKVWEQALDTSLRAKQKTQELELRVQSYDWGSYYFAEVSSPTTYETPPGGRFMFEIPAGRYVLGAATGYVPKSAKERHYWMVKVALKAGEEKIVTLSNDNLTTSGSEESILRTSELKVPSLFD